MRTANHRCRGPVAETVSIEFTQGGEVVESYDVPKIAWMTFKLVAAKHGFKAEEYLTIAIAGCLQEGMNLRGAVEWLLPSEDETIERQAREESLA